MTPRLLEDVRAAVASVDDPEMPGVSIVELGMLESIDISPDGTLTVGLIPTFSGCPALGVIATEVHEAVAAVAGVDAVAVRFLNGPAWTASRVTAHAEHALAERLGIAVERNGIATCPRCGGVTRERSLFGPTRCRAIHVCRDCDEVVEVVR